MDPEDAEIKLRAATGLEAVDFFMPGYHVWAKLIESLADLGYDSNNLVHVHLVYHLLTLNITLPQILACNHVNE